MIEATMNIYRKNLHNLLLTVPHGFLLVASLNYLAISEDEHKTHSLTTCLASSVTS